MTGVRVKEDPEVARRRPIGLADVKLDSVGKPVLEEVTAIRLDRRIAPDAQELDVRMVELDARIVLEEDTECLIRRKRWLGPCWRWRELARVGTLGVFRTVVELECLAHRRSRVRG